MLSTCCVTHHHLGYLFLTFVDISHFSVFILFILGIWPILSVEEEWRWIGEMFLGKSVVGSAYVITANLRLMITSQRKRWFQAWFDYISSLTTCIFVQNRIWRSPGIRFPTEDIDSLPSAHRETTFITRHVWRSGGISPSSAYISIDVAYKIASV